MKELSFEKMESLNGGDGYCDLISFWYHGGAGYQGSWSDLERAYWTYCA